MIQRTRGVPGAAHRGSPRPQQWKLICSRSVPVAQVRVKQLRHTSESLAIGSSARDNRQCVEHAVDASGSVPAVSGCSDCCCCHARPLATSRRSFARAAPGCRAGGGGGAGQWQDHILRHPCSLFRAPLCRCLVQRKESMSLFEAAQKRSGGAVSQLGTGGTATSALES